VPSPVIDLKRPVAAAFGGLIRLALPPSCLACATPVAEDGGLCPACWGRLKLIEAPCCPRLAIPFAYDLGAGALSAEAIADPPPFDRMRAVAVYDDVSRRLVHGLKYRDRMELAGWMGGWMARAAADLAATADLVAPVPLHRRRLWRRRYNQSAALARTIAARTGRAFAPGLVQRIRPTRPQVGLTARQRADNTRGAFHVPTAERPALRARRVLLVDDVYTSGATVGAVTRALLRAGATAVDVVVFARVVGNSDELLY
jgi:ComF family protein